MHTFLNFDYFPLKKDSLLISPLDFKIRSFEFLETPKKKNQWKKNYPIASPYSYLFKIEFFDH